jgi:hypothetical protein
MKKDNKIVTFLSYDRHQNLMDFINIVKVDDIPSQHT